MGNQQNNSTTLKKIKEILIHDVDSIIVANNRYIISNINNLSLKIEDTYSNLSSTIQYKLISFKVIFHPRIENIFLLADGNEIKIYQIFYNKIYIIIVVLHQKSFENKFHSTLNFLFLYHFQ